MISDTGSQNPTFQSFIVPRLTKTFVNQGLRPGIVVDHDRTRAAKIRHRSIAHTNIHIQSGSRALLMTTHERPPTISGPLCKQRKKPIRIHAAAPSPAGNGRWRLVSDFRIAGNTRALYWPALKDSWKIQAALAR